MSTTMLDMSLKTPPFPPVLTSGSSAESDEERWAALCARDSSADGRFFYAVRTTGVYCRPSCASRRPLRRNVHFYDNAEAAREAGFRACKRCRPDDVGSPSFRALVVEKACRMIEESAEAPTLEALAEASELSTFHFHRVFKAVTGVTPRAYAAEARARRVREALAERDAARDAADSNSRADAARARASITSAMFDAGFGSSSSFYAAADGVLGMKPRDYARGAPRMRIRYAVAPCSLGRALVAATEVGVCSILIGDDDAELRGDLARRFPRAELIDGDVDFDALVGQAVALIDEPAGAHAELPLDVQGTAFQRRVWQALREIPAGATASYAEIAAKIGAPKAARAVAGACANNHIAVAIPCHRVVHGNGGLSGYRWGVERKRKLLEQEREAQRDTESTR